MLCKEFKTQDNKTIYRVSRWIKIEHNYNVSTRNSLYYYATDENGYREGQSSFNPENGLFLDFFTWHGRAYAIEQFYRLDFPMFFTDTDRKLHYLSGYDSEDYYNPILIELDEYCENVRVYLEQNRYNS